MDLNILDEMSSTIENAFEKFNKKAEMLLQKYDRSFADMEEELRLSGKLRMIKKRKEKLKAEFDRWEGTDHENDTAKNEEWVATPRIDSDDEKEKDDLAEKEMRYNDKKTRQKPKTAMNDAGLSQHESEEINKKLELSIRLAAKYKEQTIDLERRLNDSIRSEQNIRAYLNDATQKEAEAKTRLEEFMTGLLERAETAEEKLKIHKRQLRSQDPAVDREHSQKRSHARSTSTGSLSPTEDRPPPHRRNITTSKTPNQGSNDNRSRSGRMSPGNLGDKFVSQILEPPSSQELPRRWNKKKRNGATDQLAGVDLSNIIDISVVWPFSEPRNITTKPGVSSTDSSCIAYPEVAIKRRIVLFCVFAYLDTDTLLRCSLVCREWKDVSKHPKLWSIVCLDSKEISTEFLATLSAWCTETSLIRLSRLTGRSRLPGETFEEYAKASLGSLEDGLECLLQSCGKKLLVLSIEDCDPFITRRALWLASCYNRELRSVTFHSVEPLTAEIVWSLGSGCRSILSLDIAPPKFCKTPESFNNRVVQMIAWCWPDLRGLSIGGKCIDKKGLLSIASSCQNIRVLELANMSELSEDLAKDLTKTGFSALHSLILTHTPIRPRALGCLLRLAHEGELVRLRVQLSFADYCPTEGNQPAVIIAGDSDRSELFEAYNAVMQSLVRLQKKPEYSSVLEVVCTA